MSERLGASIHVRNPVLHMLESLPLDPADRYAHYCAAANGTRPDVYASTTMISGGYYSLRNWGIGTPDIMALNRHVSVALYESLRQSGQIRNGILPVDIGTAHGADGKPYGESGYLAFWLALILGLSPQDATQKITRMLATVPQEFNDYKLPRETRLPWYIATAEQFTKDLSRDRNPVGSLVQLFDPSSLGATAERIAAERAGIPVKRTAINLAHPPLHLMDELQMLHRCGIRIPAVSVTGRPPVLLIPAAPLALSR